MNRIEKENRILAVALSVLLTFCGLPTTAFAKRQPIKDSRLCEHHQEHTAACGYAAAQPCGYTCELCGKTDNESEL